MSSKRIHASSNKGNVSRRQPNLTSLRALSRGRDHSQSSVTHFMGLGRGPGLLQFAIAHINSAHPPGEPHAILPVANGTLLAGLRHDANPCQLAFIPCQIDGEATSRPEAGGAAARPSFRQGGQSRLQGLRLIVPGDTLPCEDSESVYSAAFQAANPVPDFVEFKNSWRVQRMRRACSLALFAAVVAGGSFAQTRKESKVAARQELVDPPVATASAPAMSAHPSPYNFAGVQYPRIEADNRVTFHFNAPAAQKVQVSIVNVPFDMVKGSHGVRTCPRRM